MTAETSVRITKPTVAFCVALFLTTTALLLVEVISIRSAQMAFDLDYKFLIIPLTLLGISLGGIAVFLLPRRITESDYFLVGVSFFYPPSILLLFLVAQYAARFSGDTSLLVGGLFFIACLVVFSCAGVLLAQVFRMYSAYISILYACDLLGAAMGIALATLFSDYIGYEHMITLSLLVACATVVAYAHPTNFHHGIRKWKLLFTIFIPAALFVTCWYVHQVSPLACKDLSLYSVNNSYAHIDVYKLKTEKLSQVGHEFGDGLEREIPAGVRVFRMTIECGWISTFLVDFAKQDDAKFLERGIRAIPFAVMGEGNLSHVLIQGSGAGIDVTRARMFGAQNVTAIEMNPLMVETVALVAHPVAYPYNKEGVTLVVDDMRRFMETSTSTYDVILNAKSGRYGSVAVATDFVRYNETVEAFRSSLEHLNPGGVFAFTALSNWIYPRLIGTAVQALRSLGLDPAGKVILVQGREGKEELLLVSKTDFSQEFFQKISRESISRGFETPSLFSGTALLEYSKDDSVMSDDRPFYNLYLGTQVVFGRIVIYRDTLVGLMVLLTVLFLGIVCIPFATSGLEQLSAGPQRALFLGLAIFFGLSSFGFVLLEVLFIQRFLLISANPTHAFGLLLGCFLFWGGVGSLISSLFAQRSLLNWVGSACSSAVLVILLFTSLSENELVHMIVAGNLFQIVILLALVSLLSASLGVLFPIGVRMMGSQGEILLPWILGVGGAGSVLGGLAGKLFLGIGGFTVIGLLLVPLYISIYLSAVLLYKVRSLDP
ncbi:MAG: hypothetical protein AAB421_05735 [Patescibacteria group bacterium]